MLLLLESRQLVLVEGSPVGDEVKLPNSAHDLELVGGVLKTFVGLDETDLASLGRELTHEVRAVRDGFCQPTEKRAFPDQRLSKQGQPSTRNELINIQSVARAFSGPPWPTGWGLFEHLPDTPIR